MPDISIEALSKNFLDQVKRESKTPNRQTTSGIVSNNNQSAVIVDDNGTQNIINKTNQSKTNPESQTQTDICYEKNICTNRINIQTDDITINQCKINPLLYSSSGFVDNGLCVQGNLNMYGTVLVKCWDRSLQKPVFIRRKIRTPIIYNQMTQPYIDERFGINTNIQSIDSSTDNIDTLTNEEQSDI